GAAGPQRGGVRAVGAVEIDTEGRRVRVNDREVKLTMTEFNLLALLAANPGRVLTRGQLLEKVWGYLADVDYHSVDPHIQRLRKKLDSKTDSGVSLEAVPGLGYRLSPRLRSRRPTSTSRSPVPAPRSSCSTRDSAIPAPGTWSSRRWRWPAR